MNPLVASLRVLVTGNALSAAESERALGCLMDGEVSEAVAASLLTALRLKGETADELEGAVRAVRARMIPWEGGLAGLDLLDTCGTGGDLAHTVNISTAAALVVAACGVPVVKHGNRSASGNSGSSDVLSALGVAIDPETSVLVRSLSELRIAFLFAPRFHPGLRPIAAVRRALPFPTLFNAVGPLCNPASPAYQLIGTPSAAQAGLLATVLARIGGTTRVAVVAGSDGLDEVTLSGPTSVQVVEGGRIRSETWHPHDFGLDPQPAASLRVAGAAESAMRIRGIFQGEHGPARDYVLANSAAALWVTGQNSLSAGAAKAAAAIDSGAVAQLLARWAEISVSSSGAGAVAAGN
jgi:anthranilate phosphoribosyltransferase